MLFDLDQSIQNLTTRLGADNAEVLRLTRSGFQRVAPAVP